MDISDPAVIIVLSRLNTGNTRKYAVKQTINFGERVNMAERL